MKGCQWYLGGEPKKSQDTVGVGICTFIRSDGTDGVGKENLGVFSVRITVLDYFLYFYNDDEGFDDN
jgi:hypothetical protein